MRVQAFGTFDRRAHPRVGVLIEGLRAHGDTVDECNVPLGFSTAERVRFLHQPWRLPVFALRLLACWVRLAARARRLPAPDAVLVGYLGHFDVLLARLLFPRTTVVLDHLVGAGDTARDRGENGQALRRLLSGLDRRATGAADLVVVDTEENADVLPAAARARSVVVAVGAPAEWFAQERDAYDGTGPLRVLFFGLFTPLQGTPALGAALGRLGGAGVRATLVGGGQDLAASRRAAGPEAPVDWLPWVEPEDLPGLAARSDVCLGIFGAGPKALRVVPNKVFQGAAAGCALVTSDTSPQRRMLDGAAVYVPPGDPDALADALRRLAADPVEVRRLQKTAARLAAERFSAVAVVVPLRRRLAETVAARRALRGRTRVDGSGGSRGS